jgi:cytochrome c oxidase subunit 4
MYFLVYGALLVLTATTVTVNFIELGKWNVIAALTIAFTKAVLVVLFFMHVKQSSPLTKVFVATGILCFLILVTLTFSDYLTRGRLPVDAR